MRLRRLGGSVAAAVPVGFLSVFFAWPVVSILWEGLGRRGLRPLLDLAGSPSFRGVAWFTLWQAVASTVITVVVALPAAAMVARLRFRGRRLVRALVTVPFVLPTVVVAGAFEGVFDRFGLADGALRLRHTVWAILLAHLFFNYAVVVRTVGAFWAGLDGRIEDQARVLGASRRLTFLHVTLPRLWPAITAAAAIVFLFSFTSFGVILVLGGPTRATIETEIYRHAVVRLDLTAAAAHAVAQLAAVVAMVAVANRLERRRVRPARVSGMTAPRGTRWGLVGNLTVMVMVLGVPVAVLVERSLSDGSGYSLTNYAALGERVELLPASAVTALGNSVRFALAATAIAVVVGAIAALVAVHGRRLVARSFDLGLTLPLGTSAVTVGFGILLALDEPVDLRTSVWIVPIVHAVIGVPFVVRTLVPVLRSIDDRTREAAAVLGASPARVRREVDLPIGARGLAVGAAFAFAVSLGEFGATSFIPRRPGSLTAPLALFRLLGTPGEALRGQAMALAVVLMVLTASAVLVIDALGEAGEGSF
ncbi:MAG: ABC transporter permease [Acidimicrobiales bacterium]